MALQIYLWKAVHLMKEKNCSSFCVHLANTEKDNAFALYRHYYLLRFGVLKVQDFFSHVLERLLHR